MGVSAALEKLWVSGSGRFFSVCVCVREREGGVGGGGGGRGVGGSPPPGRYNTKPVFGPVCSAVVKECVQRGSACRSA